MGAAHLLELVEVGPERLAGEVISLRGERAVVQLHEYTGGLGPGRAGVAGRRPAHRRARPGAARRRLRRDAAPAGGPRRAPAPGRAGSHAVARPALALHARACARAMRVGAGAVLGTRARDRGDRGAGAGAAGRRRHRRVAGGRGRVHGGRADRDDRRARRAPRPPLAAATTAAQRPAPRRLGAAQHRPARARPAVPGRARVDGRGSRRLRHRQDGAAAADRQVVRRRRDRLRQLRRARQRAGRRPARDHDARGPAHGPVAARPHGAGRQHVEHAAHGARGQRPRRRHGGRAVPRHGLRRARDRRLDLALGRGAARDRLAHRRAARRGGLPGEPRPDRSPSFYERAARVQTLARRRGLGHDPRRDLASRRRHGRARDRAHRALRARGVVAGSRPRLRAPLPGRELVGVDLARRRPGGALARRRRAATRTGASGAPAPSRLLAEADRVQAVAELVGAASLPDHERVVLLTGRLLREAVLQQNALSDNDAWCGRRQAGGAARDGARDPRPRDRPRRAAACPARASRSSTSRTPRGRATASAPRTPPASTRSATRCWRAWRRSREGARRAHARGLRPRPAGRRRRRRRASAGTRSPRSASPRARSATASCSTSTATSRWSRSSRARTGSAREGVRVAFTGSPLRIPVGDGWLGRVCNGRGEPLDGGPPVARRADARGRRATRSTRGGARRPREPVLTGVSAIDGLATLVRGQKLPIFSVGGLPHLELAAQIAAQARDGRRAVRRHLRGDRDHPCRRGGGRRRARHAQLAGDLVVLLNTADDPARRAARDAAASR